MHEILKALDIVPTIEASRAYQEGMKAGVRSLADENRVLRDRLDRAEQVLTEIGLMARRTISR